MSGLEILAVLNLKVLQGFKGLKMSIVYLAKVKLYSEEFGAQKTTKYFNKEKG